MTTLRPPLSTLPEPEPGVPLWARHGKYTGPFIGWGRTSGEVGIGQYDETLWLIGGARLDLQSPQGWIAHAWLLRWLGNRLDTPVLRCLSMPDKVRGKWCTALSLVEGGGCGRVLWHLDYPALATLDPHDDTRLPWGGSCRGLDGPGRRRTAPAQRWRP